MTKSTLEMKCLVRLFSPKEFKGGRVKVYGCSPGCLAASIAISLLLTLAVNGCIYFLR